jgi:hypothetical protein
MKLRIPITEREAAAAARWIASMRIDEAAVDEEFVIEPILRRVLAACPELFPKKRSGVCFVCGCSAGGCAWVDREHTLCSVCVFGNAEHPDAPIPYRITEAGLRFLEQEREKGGDTTGKRKTAPRGPQGLLGTGRRLLCQRKGRPGAEHTQMHKPGPAHFATERSGPNGSHSRTGVLLSWYSTLPTWRENGNTSWMLKKIRQAQRRMEGSGLL